MCYKMAKNKSCGNLKLLLYLDNQYVKGVKFLCQKTWGRNTDNEPNPIFFSCLIIFNLTQGYFCIHSLQEVGSYKVTISILWVCTLKFKLPFVTLASNMHNLLPCGNQLHAANVFFFLTYVSYLGVG